MKKNNICKNITIFSTLLIIFIIINSCNMQKNDTLINLKNVRSTFVEPRNVDIWLPSSYYVEKQKRYPVLYMHDGQNLFNPETSTWGTTWGVAEWVKKLSAQKKIPEIIIVGIWNTPKRYLEYMPNKPFYLMDKELQSLLSQEYGGQPLGNQYLKFIVEELKPVIDSTYRTISNQKNTFIMGSSMGGLISSYAITEYPDIFRGAGCLSTHWITSKKHGGNAASDGFVAYFSENLPSSKNHKYYFDYGTIGLDSLYEPHQLKIDSVMENAGYMHRRDWLTQKYSGADHNEESWQKRLYIPLIFLLNNN